MRFHVLTQYSVALERQACGPIGVVLRAKGRCVLAPVPGN